jgi:hypothetical protein
MIFGIMDDLAFGERLIVTIDPLDPLLLGKKI